MEYRPTRRFNRPFIAGSWLPTPLYEGSGVLAQVMARALSCGLWSFSGFGRGGGHDPVQPTRPLRHALAGCSVLCGDDRTPSQRSTRGIAHE